MTISVRPLLAYLSLAFGAPATAGHGAPAIARAHTHRPDYEPRVRLWLSGDNVFQRGERARVFFRTDQDAYVLLVRLDTDGQLHMLFPDDPYDDGFVRGGITYGVSGHGRESFYVDDYPGMGYVFAIAAERPLDLDRLGEGRRWDYRAIGGRVVRDPVVAMQDLAERVLEDPEDPYGLDYSEYYVDRRVEYPRFLCYDCHSYRPYPVWDPYLQVCARYRVVVYDEPEVYRYRYSPGSRVVYAQRPPRPRYEFKEAPRGSSVTPDNFIERRRRVDTDDYRRRDARPGEPGGIDRRRRGAEQVPGPRSRSPRSDVEREDRRRDAELAEPVDSDRRMERRDAGARKEDGGDTRRRDVEPRDDAGRDDQRRAVPLPQSDGDDSSPDSPPPPSRRGRRPPG